MTTRNIAIVGGLFVVLTGLLLFAASGFKESAGAPFEPVYEFVDYEGAFSLTYPGWWMKTDVEGGAVFTNEIGTARVIVLTSDIRSSVPFGVVKEAMLRDPSYTLANFTLVPGEDPVYWAHGERLNGGRPIFFTEVGFEADGIRYQVRTEDETDGTYGDLLASIVTSFTVAEK